MRLAATIHALFTRKKERVAFRREMLMQVSPDRNIASLRMRLDNYHQALAGEMAQHLRDRRTFLSKASAMLEAFNPMAILQRGYSITRSLPDRAIVRDAGRVKIDQPLEVILADGKLRVTVDDKQ